MPTFLCRREKHKSFVYGEMPLAETGSEPRLLIRMKLRRGSRLVCSGCGRRGPGV
jgi:hypothetical protein